MTLDPWAPPRAPLHVSDASNPDATMSLLGLCLVTAATFAPAVPLRPDDPATLPTELDSVTVYPGSAMVTRLARVDGPGEFVVPGLPLAMDPDSVRVRAADGARLEVMGVEARLRFVRQVADERMAALQTERQRLTRELEVQRDQLAALHELGDHLKGLLDAEGAAADGDQRPAPEAWRAAGGFLGTELVEVLAKRRAKLREIAATELALQTVVAEYDLGAGGAGRQVRDVIIQLDGPPDGDGGELELEYLVQGAGWTPVYDLRVDGDLSGVELVHRAEVTQRTGEDWSDVELLLSTAQPEVGAAPPPIVAIWLDLVSPGRFASERMRGAFKATTAAPAAGFYFDREDQFDPAAYFAEVMTGGSSLRYRVARRETIESRPDPSTVLVGRARLDVEPERYCTPALDENVWLRGRAENRSPWVLLPGSASVYFGGDFVGQAQLDQVRLGETFDLHLGLDPMVTFERIELEQKESSSGFFGSRKRLTDGWRLRLENHGAAGSGPGRPARIIVREVLPRSTDERLDIELEDASPAVSRAERWLADREEAGILTWELDVPRGGEAVVEWTTSMTFPEDLELAW